MFAYYAGLQQPQDASIPTVACEADPYYETVLLPEVFSDGLTPYATVLGDATRFSVAAGTYGQTLTCAATTTATAPTIRRKLTPQARAFRWSMKVRVSGANLDDSAAIQLVDSATGAALWTLVPRRRTAVDASRRPEFIWRNTAAGSTTGVLLGASAWTVGDWYLVEVEFAGVQLELTATNLSTLAETTYVISTGAANSPAFDSLQFLIGTGGPTVVTEYADIEVQSDLRHTKLLLHGEAVADSSQQAKTTTALGNAASSGTQSRFGGGALAFDGSGDSVLITGYESLNLSSANYTLEAWVYLDYTSTANSRAIITNFSDLPTYAQNQVFGRVVVSANAANKLDVTEQGPFGSPSVSATSTASVPLQTWFHCSAMKAGGTILAHIDGVLAATVAATARSDFADNIRVGAYDVTAVGFEWWLLGYLDEVRVTRGVARYPYHPAPLAMLPDSSPADPLYSSVSLLLHFSGADGGTTFTDSGPNAFTPASVVAATTSAARSKYGPTSGRFITAASALYYSDDADFDFPGDFTIEAWVYREAADVFANVVCCKRVYNANGAGTWRMTATSFQTLVAGPAILVSYSIPVGEWTYVAICRSSGLLMAFINGVLIEAVANTTDLTNAEQLTIGRDLDASSTTPFNGYIEDLRITKAARYTANFTPPALPNCNGSIASAPPSSTPTTTAATMAGTIAVTGGLQGVLGAAPSRFVAAHPSVRFPISVGLPGAPLSVPATRVGGDIKYAWIAVRPVASPAVATAPSLPLTVDYATLDGSGVAGTHYTAASGTLSFNDGADQFVQITLDPSAAGFLWGMPDRTMALVLSNPVGWQLTPGAEAVVVTMRNTSVPPLLALLGANGTTGVGAEWEVQLSPAAGIDLSMDFDIDIQYAGIAPVPTLDTSAALIDGFDISFNGGGSWAPLGTGLASLHTTSIIPAGTTSLLVRVRSTYCASIYPPYTPYNFVGELTVSCPPLAARRNSVNARFNFPTV